jgi:hypothetical protein
MGMVNLISPDSIIDFFSLEYLDQAFCYQSDIFPFTHRIEVLPQGQYGLAVGLAQMLHPCMGLLFRRSKTLKTYIPGWNLVDFSWNEFWNEIGTS